MMPSYTLPSTRDHLIASSLYVGYSHVWFKLRRGTNIATLFLIFLFYYILQISTKKKILNRNKKRNLKKIIAVIQPNQSTIARSRFLCREKKLCHIILTNRQRKNAFVRLEKKERDASKIQTHTRTHSRKV